MWLCATCCARKFFPKTLDEEIKKTNIQIQIPKTKSQKQRAKSQYARKCNPRGDVRAKYTKVVRRCSGFPHGADRSCCGPIFVACQKNGDSNARDAELCVLSDLTRQRQCAPERSSTPRASPVHNVDYRAFAKHVQNVCRSLRWPPDKRTRPPRTALILLAPAPIA